MKGHETLQKPQKTIKNSSKSIKIHQDPSKSIQIHSTSGPFKRQDRSLPLPFRLRLAARLGLDAVVAEAEVALLRGHGVPPEAMRWMDATTLNGRTIGEAEGAGHGDHGGHRGPWCSCPLVMMIHRN